MIKRKNPSQIIKVANPKIEHAYIQFPGGNLINVTKDSDSKGLDLDKEKIQKEYFLRKKDFRFIHTHPEPNEGPLPSAEDLYHFLTTLGEKSMAIYSINEKGDTLGTFVIKKSKNNSFSEEEVNSSIEDYKRKHILTGKGAMRALNKVSKQFNLTYRLIPSRGYVFDEGIEFPITDYSPKRRSLIKEYGTPKFRKQSLEQKVSKLLGILGISLSIFFITPHLTGNVIGTFGKNYDLLVWAILFLFGVEGIFWYLRSKNRKNILTKK